nr:MAG TPA: hypothetical protein [Caudoviricetes sp.]
MDKKKPADVTLTLSNSVQHTVDTFGRIEGTGPVNG